MILRAGGRVFTQSPYGTEIPNLRAWRLYPGIPDDDLLDPPQVRKDVFGHGPRTADTNPSLA